MFCINCGARIGENMRFCPQCGEIVHKVNNQVKIKTDNNVDKRKILSDRQNKIVNRFNGDFHDTDIDYFIKGLGNEILSPQDLDEAIKGTPFDNEEDLSEILYMYSSLWNDQELEEAGRVFENDEGYHAAIGLLYYKGNREGISQDWEKALLHFKKAVDLPMVLGLLLGIYGQQKDYSSILKYAKMGLFMDMPAAYFYMGLLSLGGVGGVEQNIEKAKEYVRLAVEKSQGKEKDGYLEIYRDMVN